MVGFKWLLVKFVLIIPALTVVIVFIQRTATRYVLLQSQRAAQRLASPHPTVQSILNEPLPIEERLLHLNVVES